VITTLDLCRAAGVSYRQLDYMIRVGYVTVALAVTGNDADTSLTPEEVAALPERWRPPTNPGSGSSRYFEDAEADVVKRIALLVRLGLVLECAVRVARSWAEHPAWPVYLGEGVTLRVDDWHPEHPQQPDYVAAYRAAHNGAAGVAL